LTALAIGIKANIEVAATRIMATTRVTIAFWGERFENLIELLVIFMRQR
jgi:hypothetical protein